ncbi:MAG: transcription antitermination factor NusB [Bacteroidales bacterium]|nr:transcription antitermination factor NusB [Bacteroidales bacterium]
MLSRHFLRAKALQTIYAGVTAKSTSEDELLKMFDYNVSRLNDLGLLQLSTLPQLTFTAERVYENETQKFNPNPTELELLHRWAQNPFVDRLSQGFEYRNIVNRMKIDWSNHFDVFRKVLNVFKSSRQYLDFIAISKPTFDDERAIAVNAFKYLMNDETLREIIFDRDLLWEDDFDQIAQYNLMLLKEQTEEMMDEAMRCPQVYEPRNEKDSNDFNFARQLIIDTFRNLDDNEQLIRKHLQNWDLERVAQMDILLINMAVTEFTCCPSIPERVTVDEYIELSKEFSTEKSKLFINGILDKMLIELRVAGKIQKDERGMYDPTLEDNDDNR